MNMVRFKATPEQVLKIGENAATNSKPVGMGFIHFRPGPISFETRQPPENELHLDYVQGRMVKLNIWKRGDHWEMRDQCDPEYQSWHGAYGTVHELLKSVPGVEILDFKKGE